MIKKPHRLDLDSQIAEPRFFINPLVIDQLLPMALLGNCEVIVSTFQALTATDAVKEALFMRLQFILTGTTSPIKV